MAPEQAAESTAHAGEGTITLHRLQHVLGTSGMEATGGGQQRRDPTLVETQAGRQKFAHRFTSRSTSVCTSAQPAAAIARRGLKTIAHFEWKSGNRNLTASRILRRKRFRKTALPKARGVVNPTTAELNSPSRARQKAANRRPENRDPPS